MQAVTNVSIFPGYRAGLSLVKDHGTDGLRYSAAAIRGSDDRGRFDSAVRAVTSLDHAFDAAETLPVDLAVPGFSAYHSAYQVAKRAVVEIGARVPNAGARAGVQTLLAAREELGRAAQIGTDDTTAFGRELASGWLGNAAEDAQAGLILLRDRDVVTPVLDGMEGIQRAIDSQQRIDPAAVRTIDELLRSAGDDLAAQAEGVAASTVAAELIPA